MFASGPASPHMRGYTPKCVRMSSCSSFCRSMCSAVRDAIRAAVKPGDVVVDLGSGSGILAFFACEAGARKVYAIEQQHTADAAALLAKHLGLADRIEVIHERSMNVELPERGDVLVTETI